jgi:hypothetical protein
MKRRLTKQPIKLQLCRETLSVLSQAHTGRAHGGTGPTTGTENCFTGDYPQFPSYCANACNFDSDQPCP